MQTQVVSGDITQIPSDALITAVNSEGMWFGGIDGAIRRVAGKAFHSLLAQALMRTKNPDGQSFFIFGDLEGYSDINTAFKNVIFVIDDLQRPLREIVTAGLERADEWGLRTVTIPTIRTGVMAGVYQEPSGSALSELVIAVKAFAARTSLVENVIIVVYQDSATEAQLRRELGL